MCGITGLYSKSPVADRSLLLKMRDSITHRGPDDAGCWWSEDGSLGLAHRRLAIIDLSPAGHQPMKDQTCENHIVFNGEIYNYKDLRKTLEQKGHPFHSQSDTEVLLKAYREWGMDCLRYLNGAFAFCIFDAEKQTLFLARDRAGEKPLFYHHSSERFLFASELKALMSDPTFPKVINLDSLEFYLAYGSIPGSRCILNKTHKLPPAHALIFSLQTHEVKMWRYWELPFAPENTKTNPEELADELECLLKDAVRRQMVADVPVGILLSGGLDSSLVTALASSVSSNKVKTFTITFPENNEYNEGPYAKLVAEHFGTEHTELIAEPTSIDLLPILAQQFDEPMADSSMLPTYLVSKLIRKHCTVALGGDGGDELFGGYPTYNRIFKQVSNRWWVPALLRNFLSTSAKIMLPLGFRGRNFLTHLGGTLSQAESVPHLYDNIARQKLVPILKERCTCLTETPEQFKISQYQIKRELPGMFMAADFQTYLPEDILVKVDRASMLNSLEVRVPFLDYRIIEFAFTKVPNSFRADHTQRKILLRRLGSRLLPSKLDLKRKQGFSLPLHDWLSGKFGICMKDVLFNTKDSIFDKKMVNKLWTGQMHGYSNSERLFALVLFELWRKHYNVTLS